MRSSNQKISCTNCGSELYGEYCSHCGQKNTFKSVSFKDAFGALVSGLLSVERGIIGTIWAILRNPHKVVDVYWKGGRYFFLTPGQMILYFILVIGLHLTFFGDRILGFNVQLTGVPTELKGLFNAQLLFVILILPLTAMTTFIAFYKLRKIFVEHFLSAVYVFSMWAIILTIITDAIGLIFNYTPEVTALIFVLLIFIWNVKIFRPQATTLRLIGTTLLQLAVFLGLQVILVILLYLFDPSTLNFSMK